MKRRLFVAIVGVEIAILGWLITTRVLWPLFHVGAEASPLAWTHLGDVQLPSTPFEVDSTNYLLKWDREVLVHNRLLSLDSSPTVKGYLAGRALTLYLSPLHDLGEWEKSYTNDIALSPTGEVLVLMTVVKQESSSKKIAQLLLIYDAAGKLLTRVDCAPYAYSTIAADDQGQILAFGYKIGSGSDEDFPMLVKLSLRGEVLGGFHPRSMHSPDADPTSTLPFGSPKLFFREKSVWLWVGNTGELFGYDLSGEPRLVRRISLKEHLLALDTELWTKVSSEIDFIGPLKPGKLLVQVRTTKDLGDLLECAFRLYEIGDDGGWAQIATATATPQPGRVLGFDSIGNVVSIRVGPNRERLLTTYALN